jgi:hypothetical protein
VLDGDRDPRRQSGKPVCFQRVFESNCIALGFTLDQRDGAGDDPDLPTDACLSVTPECGNSPVFAVIVLIFRLISPRSNV